MTPEEALYRAVAFTQPHLFRTAALQGVPDWLSVLLPLRITPGEGIPVWHAPPGADQRWYTARTMLVEATELWPDDVAQVLRGTAVHDAHAAGQLSWRPGAPSIQVSPTRFATLLRSMALEQLQAGDRMKPRRRLTQPI